MSGLNSSVNNAIHIVRRGGDVILFGLKSGDAIIESFDRVIVDGIAMHSVIGRRVWETWHITRHLLESRDPNIHDLIWEVILNRGDGPIVDFDSYKPDSFEERIQTFPKVVFKFYEADFPTTGAMFDRAKPIYQTELDAIREAGLEKRERIITTPQAARIESDGRSVLNFCANNYLGLSSNPRVISRCEGSHRHARLRPEQRTLHLRHPGSAPEPREAHREVLRHGRHHPLLVLLRRQRRPVRDAARPRRRHHQRRAQSRVHHRRRPPVQGRAPSLRERRHGRARRGPEEDGRTSACA